MLKEAVLLLLLITCAYTDLTKRLILNRVLLPAALFGLIYAGLNNGMSGLQQSLTGMMVGFLLLLLPFYLGGLGAGDVKMLATIGALQGPQFTIRAFIFSALVGGVWALIYLIRRGRLGPTMKILLINGLFWWYGSRLSGLRLLSPVPTSQDGAEETLPYGAVLALGTLLTYLSG